MSIKLMSQLWDNEDPELSGPRLLIMLCLADHANDDGFCFPSIDRIATRARIQNRNAMRYIQELEAAGYLQVNRVSGKHNTYVVFATSGKFTTSDNSTTSGKNKLPPVVNSTKTSGKFTTLTINHQEPSVDTAPKKRARPPNAIYEIAVALADVCRVNFALKKKMCLDNAADLVKLAQPPATPELIRERYNGGGWWYANDWRGKKGDPPNLATLRETWGQWGFEPPEMKPYASETY